jgi:oligoendopeptidase F
MSVEDAARQAEIDIENPEFWRNSLRSVEKMIEEFISLAE